MAGESAAWKATADKIFASFGDVVRSAVVFTESDTAVYNPATGTMTKTSVQTRTAAVPVQFKFKLFGREKYQDEDLTLMVRGSDFSGRVPLGARIALYAVDGTTIEGNYVVIQNDTSDAGTGAFFYLHVRRAGVTLTVT